MPEPIDWTEMMEGYNRKMKKNHSDVRLFIIAATNEHGIEEFSEILGVSKSAIDRIRYKFRVTKSFSPEFKPKKKIFQHFVDNNDTSKFSVEQMAKRLKISKDYIYTLCRSKNIPYRSTYTKEAKNA